MTQIRFVYKFQKLSSIDMSKEREVRVCFQQKEERRYWGKKMRREREKGLSTLGFCESRVHKFFIRSWQLCKICKIRCIRRIVILCKVRKANCKLLQSIHGWFNNGIVDHGVLIQNHLEQLICGFFRLVVEASEQLLTLWINFSLS